jgi:hypothetical protein
MRLRRDVVAVDDGITAPEADLWLHRAFVRLMPTSEQPSVTARFERLRQEIRRLQRQPDPVAAVDDARALLDREDKLGAAVVRFADAAIERHRGAPTD